MSTELRVIGLTGGIACGKSTVAHFFSERGVPVIDADQLARAAVQPGSAVLQQIADLFGTQVLDADGALNRQRLGAIVFADARKRCQLEALLHPQIRCLAEQRIAQAAAAGHRQVIYMAPLLLEAGGSDRVSEIWVVSVAPEVQLERLMRRDGLSRVEAQRRIDSQMPLAEKVRYGTVVIDNSGTPQHTERILKNLWETELQGEQ